MTALLREKLAPTARIVNTNSSLHRYGKLDAVELNRRGPATMSATAFHPGTVRSGLDRESALVAAVKATAIGRLVTRSPDEGAEPLVRIATTGQAVLRDAFYDRLERRPLRHPAVTDAAFGARLWDRATEITRAPAWHRRPVPSS